MRRVHIHRNLPRSHRNYCGWGIGRMPVRQTFLWVGPLFIRIAPKR